MGRRSVIGGVVTWLLVSVAACAGGRGDDAPRYAPPPPGAWTMAPPPGAPVAPDPPAAPLPATGPDEWQPACAQNASCGACLNHGPCQWCAGEDRCVGPRTACGSEIRVEQSGACYSAPLEVARRRYPRLADQLARYELQRESKDVTLAGTTEDSFFLNTGDCFAVLAEPLDDGAARLGYALRVRGTPRPGDRVAPPVAGTGGQEGRAELSPEFCPWEHQPLFVWNAQPQSSAGAVRLRLLRRAHPDPQRLARERPATPAPRSGGIPRGGSCSSFECGEDCRSEHRACELDCFRYGSHEPGPARACKATCSQLARACERSCAVPCP